MHKALVEIDTVPEDTKFSFLVNDLHKELPAMSFLYDNKGLARKTLGEEMVLINTSI